MKKIVKGLIPPIFLSIYHRFFTSKYGWKGLYKTWQDAESVSTGYDQTIVLEKVRSSLLAVKNGEAVYERDSVLFDQVQYNWPLLSALMLGAAKKTGSLSVMDFGGSLGSTYFQNKKFIELLPGVVKWGIVEQKHFVDAGKQEFESDELKFFYDIDSCLEELRPGVLLLSSVLQYIEQPYHLLEKLLSYNFDLIIVDRTPFTSSNNDVIKVQYVPPSIYDASYPCWFFNKEKLCNYFVSHGYELFEEFDALDGFGDDYAFHGLLFKPAVRF